MGKIDTDVIIIGAGIAGITSAYYLQKNFPHLSYKILESRKDLGGTWDLMKYPGVRSDSDMYTYGFSFNPWQGSIIGKGEEIKQYISDTVKRFNIKQHILLDTKVTALSWKDKQWNVQTKHNNFTSKYIICSTGYYNFKDPYTPTFDNEEKYQGQIVHTQHWKNTNVKDKNVTIIGGGCTAVTMTPHIVEQAKSVTLVQRSPGWIVNVSSQEKSRRWYKILQSTKNYLYSKTFKKLFKNKILSNPYYNKTNTPAYNFWDQRPTCSLDNDYFYALQSNKVTVEHQEVSKWETKGVKLQNGKVVDSDITVMATGLNLQMLGGINIFVNNKKINVNDTSWYRGMMFSGIPNLFSHQGYVNFSWTARCEIVSQRICKTLKYMHKKKLTTCTPKYLGEKTQAPLQSNYILRAMGNFPKKTYKFYQSYLIEYTSFKWAKINDGAIDFK